MDNAPFIKVSDKLHSYFSSAKIIKNLISEELIIVTDENRANHTGTNIYYQDEYDGRDTNRLNEVCQQSTSGRLPQYKGQFNYS